MLLLARVGRIGRKLVELVGVLETGAAEALGKGTVRVVDLDRLLLGVMRAGPATHHFRELGPIVVGECHRVVAADPAAFADEAQDALADLGVVVHHAADVVQEHGIEFLDLRVFEHFQIVAEGGLEGARILGHQFEHEVAVRNGLVPGVHLQVGHQQLARLPGLDNGFPRGGGIDLLPHVGG